jgi:6-phosphogluconolactonase
LGIGEDGHIASLFPEHSGLKELSPVFAVYDSPKKPLRRLTMSFAVLNRCQSCFILAGGAEKGLVFEAVRAGGVQPRYPVSLLVPDHCVWFLDEAARAACDPG